MTGLAIILIVPDVQSHLIGMAALLWWKRHAMQQHIVEFLQQIVKVLSPIALGHNITLIPSIWHGSMRVSQGVNSM